MATGKIKRWIGDRGFGFIKNDDGGDDVFLHINKVDPDDRSSLIEGAEVAFDIQNTSKGLAADNVSFQETTSSAPGATKSTPSSSEIPEFHNPYTFVPSPRRQDAIETGGFSSDFDPLECALNHASLKSDLWTGHLSIKLTTITPLVLPKTDGEERSSTEPYDVLDHLPESSLRGMLRSAYEVVTNSRYGCFSNDKPLKYRSGWKKTKYEKSPEELLDTSLKPAKERNKLSPADRLFGWVPQQSDSDQGYKGRIRIVCEDDARPKIIQHFDGKDLPLTILGEPKPPQGRFYVAKDDQGTPQDDGIINKQQAGYSEGKGLRGRKHYWHHKGLEADQAPDYWKSSVEDRTQQQSNGRYQEYRRPDQSGQPQKDSQNRSITGWIEPDTVFKASLYVQNLQTEEIGALLWLLSLPEDHYFRLGYGKPLGFGSVRVEVDEERCVNGCMPLGTGEDWKDYYASFDVSSPATLDEDRRNDCIQKFKASMVAAYNPIPANPEDRKKIEEQHFDELPFISGFLQVLSGPKKDAPIHYPRLEYKPNPKGENFRWFVENEKGKKLALPAVTDEKGLLYQP